MGCIPLGTLLPIQPARLLSTLWSFPLCMKTDATIMNSPIINIFPPGTDRCTMMYVLTNSDPSQPRDRQFLG
ncbi:hypothetical protein M501DRAFT_139670 [Patellaria atrata CBS 101060]|uniref:Uncharacterized protein n=1 Tax=Patellaria atrata CBS 101060 TaxID=1346257 RepID=A0A9P4S812_9PEZI|nr:hypothetical protein M501DRAFT_139670 [Patellaria atrata CBS 101060]